MLLVHVTYVQKICDQIKVHILRSVKPTLNFKEDCTLPSGVGQIPTHPAVWRSCLFWGASNVQNSAIYFGLGDFRLLTRSR